MKKHVTKFLSMTLALALAMTSVPAFAVKAEETNQAEAAVETVTAETVSGADIVASGSCGNDATYTLDSDGNMVISGTGEAIFYEAEEDEDFGGLYESWGFIECVGDLYSVKNVTIEDGITGIGESLFSGCSAIKNISIPKSVTSIGGYAFCGCTSLTTVNIPEGVVSIGGGAFYECTSLTTVNIPESVVTIGSDVFCDCTNLETLNIPDSVMDIGSNAFNGTKWLKNKYKENPFFIFKGKLLGYNPESTERNVVIPDGVTSIDYFAFDGCTSLTSVSIPNGVTSIGGYAFCGCTSLTSVSMPNGVTSIGEYAFDSCTNLETLNIPDSVMDIGRGAFAGTEWLKNKYKENPFFIFKGKLLGYDSKNAETEVVVPVGITEIKGGVFSSCYNIRTLTIPNTVTRIEAIVDCYELETIYIPNSVTYIEVIDTDREKYSEDCVINYEGTQERWNQIFKGDFQGTINYNSKMPEIEPPHTHKAGEWTVTKAATEDAVGTKVKKCTGCGEVLETAEIAKLPCSHKTSKWVVTTEATAKKAGLKEKKCSKCGKVLDSEKLPKFKVTLNATKVSLQQGKSTTAIKATVMKGDKVKSWKSSDAKVATVNSKGKITAKKAGTATITVTTKKGAKATVKVTVQKKAVTCTKLKVDKKKLTLKVKKSYQLNVTKTPVTTLEKVTYKSSNKKVATVNSKGKITAKKAGKATITVKCGKKTVKVQVTVKKK